MIAWKLWTGVPRVKLWEGVALVLEIDPKSLEPSPHAWMSAGPGREADPSFLPRSFPSKEKCRAFDVALDFAERATSYAGPIQILSTPFQGMSKRSAEVALPEVVAFFVSCEWPDIPAPLLALVESVAGTAEPSQPEQAPELEAPPLEDWKMRVHAEAAAHWLHLRKLNCNPTKHGILPHLAKWCREKDIRTASNINPSEGYLRTHVLNAWEPPR